MNAFSSLETERLILRRWKNSDRDAFAEMNADSEVMEFFPNPMSGKESDTLVDRIEEGFVINGFGLCAAELQETREFIGFVGLSIPSYETPFTPCIEIGWRLARFHWGKGLATEAARRVLAFGFEDCDLKEIVSFTALPNVRSMRLMERLGMTRDSAEDFNHPMLEDEHWLRRHVLYRLSREEWRRSGTA